MRERNPTALADRLKQMETAAAAPLVATAPAAVPQPSPTVEVIAPQKQGTKSRTVTRSVFLRIPEDLHEHLDGLAIARTKATGRGVTVQQIILEQLEAKRSEA